MLKNLLIITLFIFCFIPAGIVQASPSVGMGVGKIDYEFEIVPGSNFQLGQIVVYNDGSETGEYEIKIMFNESQPQLKPEPSWITFSTKQFILAPGASQTVTLTLNIPVNSEPGDYFAYLEAQISDNTQLNSPGVTNIGASSATKLTFKVGQVAIAKKQVLNQNNGQKFTLLENTKTLPYTLTDILHNSPIM